ncbi:type-F conjugative transfer system mating-pair stabilization protein TraN (plasmid) [Pectobacterium odoriferum]|uniref:type-F conjugative transfer system mating-pair stabilization protein TraN n=1 Tax=Pectobacterium odoriferum TaxID=78398 RepID=UPI0013745DDC|nr:type-F conjugative transfer system mating-pair stabilization protein TraN [Pectobacterium odoriferum]QHP82811.1 type-F conjugative transfer system mating-pair stabilization protein TraN [Pectobacterium odoriferum]
MRPLVVVALLLSFSIARADSNQDAFNAGANFGKGSASQATNSLSNPGIIAESIPGYTNTPPQSGYYGGVRGDDGGISNKGLIEFNNSDVGKAITDSSIRNPATIIDPTATFITNGKSHEANADSIVDGTNKQCTETFVSKSTYEKYICDRDVYNENSCERTAEIGGDWSGTSVEEVVVIDISGFTIDYDDATEGYKFSVISPVSGVVKSAKLEIVVSLDMWNGSVNFMNTDMKFTTSEVFNLNAAGIELKEKDVISSNIICSGYGQYKDSCRWDYTWVALANLRNIKLTMVIGGKSFKPEIKWSEVCAINKNEVPKISEVCIEPGGEKTITVEGKEYALYSDCWKYQETYAVPSGSEGNCGSLSSAANCTVVSHQCTSQIGTYCEHENVTYECETKHESSGLLCGGDYFCQSGDCAAIDGASDSGFDMAVAKLAGLASAADDVKDEQESINVKAFTGEAMSCRKAIAGFSNCCKDSGWGADVGLSQCNSDEMALGKAKAKKVTVSIGERCDRKALGVCLQKSQVYCVFGGKLARIIQEQGRRDQLSIGFGSGSSPDCRGITVPELQGIDFDKLNFSDFYEDLMTNQTVPNTDVMVKQVKDRIAAQVQQSGASK